MGTFKIYSDTNFDDLKHAAVKYWKKSDASQWIITDEFFNNLTSFKDTII